MLEFRHHVTDAIGGQDQFVHRLPVQLLVVDFNGGLDTQRAADATAVFSRVVAGQAGETVITQPVGAAVADMKQVQLLIFVTEILDIKYI